MTVPEERERQRTQAINARRGHLEEYGVVVAKGPSHVAKLIAHVEDPAAGLPAAARTVLRVLTASLQSCPNRSTFSIAKLLVVPAKTRKCVV